MTARISVHPHAWVPTDVTVRVEKASRGACDIVGSTPNSGDDDVLQLLSIQRRTLLFDIERALTGWLGQRTVLVRLGTQRWPRFGYRVPSESRYSPQACWLSRTHRRAEIRRHTATRCWWTAMIITTMGSQYWPVTPEGRVLCLALSLYRFAVLGYVTAALAGVFIGQEAQDRAGSVASSRQVNELALHVQQLREPTERLQRV